MADPTINRDSDKFMLRLPDGMRDRIKAAAEESKRSMNAEIVARLEGSFDTKVLDDLGASQIDLVSRIDALEAVMSERFGFDLPKKPEPE